MYILAIALAKVTYKIIQLLKLGSGYTWSGHLTYKVFPNILKTIQKKVEIKTVFITGTNGKTTTTKLISHILNAENYRVLHNKTGANLVNGFISTILLNTTLAGQLNYDYLIFEVDEFNLPKLLKYVQPNVLALLNLSRDQLDRHWEVDLVLEKWQNSLTKINKAILVLDQEQKEFLNLAKNYKGKTHFFNASTENLQKTNLIGDFNAKNLNCALLVTSLFDVSQQKALKSLESFDFAYGRGETVIYKEHNYRIFLAKNPESLNQNLQMLTKYAVQYDVVLLVLNDNIPDGKDVSWIYDASPILLKQALLNKKVYVAGTRALDMAIRLNYADVEVLEEHVFNKLSAAFVYITNLKEKDILVLPNYSAMLEIRKLLTGRKIL